MNDTTGASKREPEGLMKKSLETNPLFKLGEQQDIAMAAFYLASDSGFYFSRKGILDAGLYFQRKGVLGIWQFNCLISTNQTSGQQCK